MDQNIVRKIINSSGLKAGEIVLEIGPGTGALTIPMAKICKKVVAIEKDESLAKELRAILKKEGIKNVEIIEADALEELKKGPTGTVFKKLGSSYKAIANIPYYLTSPLIRALLEARKQPEEITLMVQKEVAERIIARPGKMNLLAVSVQYYADPKKLFIVSKNCFWPKPKIDSAIISLKPKRKYSAESDNFFAVVKAGFSSPRKQLINNLSTELKLTKDEIKNLLLKAGLKPSERAEALTIGDWEKLTIISRSESYQKGTK